VTEEMPLGAAARLGVECGDCGRSRWLRPVQLVRRGVTLHTPLADVSSKLSCSACRSEGLGGKNVTVQAFFSRDADRVKAEAEVLRNQVALSEVSRAKGA
jgi:hypothetical protein